MSDSIQSIPVISNGVDNFKTRWGSTVNDYMLNSASIAFQDLLVAISERRATAVEAEIPPMTTKMRTRNTRLEKLGTALSELTKAQATFKKDAEGGEDMGGWFTPESGEIFKEFIKELNINFNADGKKTDLYYSAKENGYSANKKTVDALTEKVKSVMDSLNNKSQTDMTRLQSLVDRRDESFSTATTIMSSVSDTIDNAIRNI